LVLPAGKILRPVDLGAAAACGHDHLFVYKIPFVTILPTGTELVPIGTNVKKGDIIEYNSVVLGAQIIDWGGKVRRFPITIDNFDLICEKIMLAALDSDLILLNAGSSAGAEDFSSKVVETLGELYVHGIAVRPGHPVILGMIHTDHGRHVPIIGVPGYPVSAAMTNEIFVKPLIYQWSGKNEPENLLLEAKITKKITSPAGDDDYVRIVAGIVNDQILASPLSRGAGVISSLVKADGYTILPRGIQGVEAGEKIKIYINKSKKDIENTIFVIGSHDLTIDLLADYVSKEGKRLVSTNVGSLGGLISIRRGESHFGGSHLLDENNGQYNISYVRKYLTDFSIKVVVVNWVLREQGFIVQSGNPKSILTLDDLSREDITFVNRQRGAGTRVLLDYHLSKKGILPDMIRGYDHEEFTHLAIAASIGSGRSDAGLGIASAAKALGLDFVPLYPEQYDLIFPKEFFESKLLLSVRKAMSDLEFLRTVQALDGYNVDNMGKIVFDQ
jgi:putative molybdopterin biosynthesis protein